MNEYISWPAGFSVDPRKVRDYLLDPESQGGHGKTAFFERLGHRRSDPATLVRRLHLHTDLQNFVGIRVAPRGHKLIFESPVSVDAASPLRLRSIW